jgi:hypothetical protein
MKTSMSRAILLPAFLLLLPAAAHAGKSTAEILPPVRRQATITLAEELLNRTPPPPITGDLPSPFNPVDFDKPDPSEIKAAGPSLGTPGTPATPGGPVTPNKPVAQSDRSILEAIAARIPVTGTIVGRDGKPILTGTNGRKFTVGNIFTVSYDNQDYDLEVVAIDRTTFTLRYRGEEITRNIRQK